MFDKFLLIGNLMEYKYHTKMVGMSTKSITLCSVRRMDNDVN